MPIKPLSERLDEYVGKGNGADLLDFLREVIAADPVYLDDLVPGMRVQPQKLTIEERSKKANAISVAKRLEMVNRQTAKVVPIIEGLLAKNPDITVRDIGKEFERLKLSAPRGGRWSPTTIQRIMRKAGLGEPTST